MDLFGGMRLLWGGMKYAKEADQMVTNGAYQITEWVHDDHITMEKLETYYDARLAFLNSNLL